jgi:hypothetical protein
MKAGFLVAIAENDDASPGDQRSRREPTAPPPRTTRLNNNRRSAAPTPAPKRRAWWWPFGRSAAAPGPRRNVRHPRPGAG